MLDSSLLCIELRPCKNKIGNTSNPFEEDCFKIMLLQLVINKFILTLSTLKQTLTKYLCFIIEYLIYFFVVAIT